LYKYSGKERDFEANIQWYYFGARYYDPEIGRWVSVDPLAGKYPSFTPYNYVLNNPLNAIDPNGLDTYLIITGAPYLNYRMAGDVGDVGKNFELAAQTRAQEIKQGSNFDASKDAVVIINARSTKQFLNATNNQYESGEIVELNVFSHGYSEGISLGGEQGNNEQLNVHDKREINRNTMSGIDNSNFTENATIDINSCNVGQRFAQDLANQTGKQVQAFTGPTQFQTNKDGTVKVVPTYIDKDKETFYPEMR
jgi:RHS repeat-associated protein